MNDRPPREKKPKAAARRAAEAARGFALLDRGLLAAAAGLLVATPLIPSEATVHQGTSAPLNLLWLLLLFAWAVGQVLRPDPQVKFGWTGAAAAALIAWHTLAALAAGLPGNGRQALNMLWQFVSYATAAFLLRQLLHLPVHCRALVAVMIALAAIEATQGYYEYFISKPADRAMFAKNPEAAYQEVGAETAAQKQQFRWRLESKEPLGTFALTNSLAGLLAPWLVALVGIGLTLLGGGERRWPLLGVVLLAAVLAGCLLLTKSRTGILAAVCGIALLLLFARPGGWRLDWRIPALAAAALVVLALAVVAVGGLDVQVLSQAPMSVLYRVQYWRATAQMIADHPLLGIGPGQFQAWYARYKLPEASETIADPHNFLLEIWSTAGTPALLALLALAGCFAWQLGRGHAAAANAERAADRFAIYAGGFAGLVAAFPLGMIVGYPPLLVAWPMAIVAVWLLDAWIRAGRLPTAVPVIALIVLLVNLLAAGATSFPGVFEGAWLLAPLALAGAGAPSWHWRPSRTGALALLAGALLLAVLCARTQLAPVLGAASHIARAKALLETGRARDAEDLLDSAAQLDPWSPEPWQLLAELRLQVWLQSGQSDDWQQFLAAAMEYGRRDPRHHAQFTIQGSWLLRAWHKSGDARLLEAASEAYRQAAAWYPNRAIVHAQLAWTLDRAGRADEAAAEAQTALELDARNPHVEHKLANQSIYDPAATAGSAPSAEQIVRRLRTGSTTENSP